MTITASRRAIKRPTSPKAAKPAPSPVAAMRARILAFLATQSEPVDKSAIKEHLGLDPWDWNSALEQALKTRRIHIYSYHRQIGTLPYGGALYAATPCKLYSLAIQNNTQ